MFIARKISLRKWREDDELGVGAISADAVTSDLRTQDNTLSFWRCEEAAEVTGRAALAMGAAAERLDRIDLVWLAEEELRGDGQAFRLSGGRTPVADLADSHVDLVRLDATRLVRLAQRVADAVAAGRALRISAPAMRKLLADAIANNRVDVGSLKPTLRGQLESGRSS